jgi:hypothetical protein
MLSAYCATDQTSWDKYLQLVMMAYRSSNHTSTQVSPNKMVYGREIVLPLSAMIGTPLNDENQFQSKSEYAEALRHKIVEIHEFARKNIRTTANYQKRNYDTNAKQRRYHTGQFVWLHDPTRKKGVCTKLVNKWKGPYIVTGVIDDLVCLVKRSNKHKAKAYHIDRLWPYSGVNGPTWCSHITNEVMQSCNDNR